MKKQVLVFCLLSLISWTFGWRSFKVIFTSFTYEFHKEKLEGKIEIRNDTGETSINAQVTVLEQLDDLILSYVISIEKNDGNFTRMLTRSTHFCKFLTTKTTDPILKVIYEDLLKHGNFFKSCPLHKGIYYLHDYKLDEEMLPSYVPETTLAVDIFLKPAKKEILLFQGRLIGKIDKSKGFDNLKIFSLG